MWDMRKVLVAIGVLIVILLLFRVWGSLHKDNLGPELAQVLATQATLIEISHAGIGKLNDSGLDISAANIAVVSESDAGAVLNYYRSHYNQKFALQADKDAVDSLAATPLGVAYDSAYKSAAKDLLASELESLKTSSEQAKDGNLKSLLDGMEHNVSDLISQL